MRQPPVTRDEDELPVLLPQHAEDPDVDLVLEVLIARLVGDRPLIAHRPHGVVLPDGRGQPTLRRDTGDPAEYRLVVVL
jgi:hypothetical protein